MATSAHPGEPEQTGAAATGIVAGQPGTPLVPGSRAPDGPAGGPPGAAAGTGRRAWRWAAARFTALDLLSAVFLVAGLACVAGGALPVTDATRTFLRILPLLVFLGSVIVLAELTAAAEVFDVVAARIAIAGRGRFAALFVLCVLFAAVTTAALNLDTTAVLLTPVILATAARIGSPRMPLAMTTVWLANTASLLLPVSNLTNLLAANRVALATPEFARIMLAPQLASVAATMACLWVFYWRRGVRRADRYAVPAPYRPGDRVLFGVAGSACVLFIAGVLAGLSISVMAPAAAAVVLVAFAVRRRRQLANWRLIPLQLLAFVTGLFLVVDTIALHGAGDLLRGLVGTGNDTLGVLRAAGSGALVSNLVNNLPTYVALEHVVPVANHRQLLGLLIGTNVGPIVSPWASLATLLWYSRCRARDVEISWGRFVATGLVTAVVVLLAGTGTLLLVS